MKEDRISSLVFLALSIAICGHAIRLNIGTLTSPASGFFPFLSGSVLGLISLEVLLRSFLKRQGLGPKKIAKDINLIKVFCVLGVLVGDALVMTTLGFAASTFLLFLSLFWASEKMTWWKALLASGAASAASYLFFVSWLQCQLPPGIVGY